MLSIFELPCRLCDCVSVCTVYEQERVRVGVCVCVQVHISVGLVCEGG